MKTRICSVEECTNDATKILHISINGIVTTERALCKIHADTAKILYEIMNIAYELDKREDSVNNE